MSGDYDRLRRLLLQSERDRLDALDRFQQDFQQETASRFERIPDQLADDIGQSLKGRRSRLSEALAEATTGSLELAVHRQPQAVVNAVYPVMGPAIRRSVGEALRQMADDLDQVLSNTLSLRALKWRLEAWRSGTSYAQVVLRHTSRYQVEHLFLIEPETGRLLGHVTASGLPELDADAVAGMFTAIQQFVRDSVSAGDDGGGIGSATVGDYRLIVNRGPKAKLVAFVRGTPVIGFGTRLHELNEELHARYGAQLVDPDSEPDSEQGFLEQAQLDELNQEARIPPKLGHRSVFIALVIALIALLAYVWSGYRWSSQAQRMRTHIRAEPGLVISDWDAAQRGRLKVDGLRDPLAEDPQVWLAKHYPDVKAEWRLRSFISLEPAIVRRRVSQLLDIPERAVSYNVSSGVVRLSGNVSFPEWYRAVHATLPLPGVTAVDASALVYPGKAHIDRLIVELESQRVLFASGTAMPSAEMDEVIAGMHQHLHELQDEGAVHGIAFRLRARGFSDDPGTYVLNRSLRQRRAEWLAARLMESLHSPSTVTIDQETVDTLPSSSIRATSVAITPFPVKP